MYLGFGDHLFWNISVDSKTCGKLLLQLRVGNYNKEKSFLPIKTRKEGSQELTLKSTLKLSGARDLLIL